MTDNDVIKALDCCCNHADCRACPKLKEKSGCVQRAIREGLKLINRLKAENESLKKRQKPTAASGYKVENGKSAKPYSSPVRMRRRLCIPLLAMPTPKSCGTSRRWNDGDI